MLVFCLYSGDSGGKGWKGAGEEAGVKGHRAVVRGRRVQAKSTGYRAVVRGRLQDATGSNWPEVHK